MAYSIANNPLLRKHFAKIDHIIEIPNLIDIQKNSYRRFLQADVPAAERQNIGLEAVFRSVFPIRDFSETCSLEYVAYDLGTPKYDVEECHQRGMTFSAPIKVKVRLVTWDVDKESGTQSIRDIKEQEIYFGEIPLMTDNGTFIINGTERVIVSQLHRSPGVFFDHDKGKTHSSGKILYNARVIPYRGSWLDFDFDHKDILYVRIDRRRKLPATVLLRALGYTTEELLNYYYDLEEIRIDGDGFAKRVNLDLLAGQRAANDVITPDGEVIVKSGRKFTRAALRKLEEAGVEYIPVAPEDGERRVVRQGAVDAEVGAWPFPQIDAAGGQTIGHDVVTACPEPASFLRSLQCQLAEFYCFAGIWFVFHRLGVPLGDHFGVDVCAVGQIDVAQQAVVAVAV